MAVHDAGMRVLSLGREEPLKKWEEVLVFPLGHHERFSLGYSWANVMSQAFYCCLSPLCFCRCRFRLTCGPTASWMSLVSIRRINLDHTWLVQCLSSGSDQCSVLNRKATLHPTIHLFIIMWNTEHKDKIHPSSLQTPKHDTGRW